MDYDDFNLNLAWDKTAKQVTITDVKANKQVSTTYHPSSPPASLIQLTTNYNGFLDKEEILKKAGEEVAKLLLPSTIRGNFITFFTNTIAARKRVRLRLIYPQDETQSKELLQIPWEYAYLDELAGPSPDSFLGFLACNPNISIVHQLVPTPNKLQEASVERLKAKIAYISWIDKNQSDPKIVKGVANAFEDFNEELKHPHTQKLFRCDNIIGDTPLLKEPGDANLAFGRSHLVHIISHGAQGTLKLKDKDLTTIALPEKIEARAVVLVACDSSSGDVTGIATTLHQKGVRVVIGMSDWIDIGPATNFVDGFYKWLFDPPDNSIEQAVVNGRREMLKPKDGRWYAGFGIPRAFLHGDQSQIIKEELLYLSQEMVTDFANHQANLRNEPNISEDKKVQKKLQDWIDQKKGAPTTRWYFLSGFQGKGKSTQLAFMLQKQQKAGNAGKFITHFCIEDKPDTSDPLQFICRSLVPQLAKYLGPDKYKDWCRPGEFPILEGNAQDALEYFVIDPLKKAREQNQN